MGRTVPEDRAVPIKCLAIFLDGDADDRDALASTALLKKGLQAHLDVYRPAFDRSSAH